MLFVLRMAIAATIGLGSVLSRADLGEPSCQTILHEEGTRVLAVTASVIQLAQIDLNSRLGLLASLMREGLEVTLWKTGDENPYRGKIKSLHPKKESPWLHSAALAQPRKHRPDLEHLEFVSLSKLRKIDLHSVALPAKFSLELPPYLIDRETILIEDLKLKFQDLLPPIASDATSTAIAELASERNDEVKNLLLDLFYDWGHLKARERILELAKLGFRGARIRRYFEAVQRNQAGFLADIWSTAAGDPTAVGSKLIQDYEKHYWKEF